MSLPYSGTATPLSPADITAAAGQIAVDPAVIQAVMMVETGGGTGFLTDGSGRPQILFEAQQFSQLTGGIYDSSNPDISSASWNPSLYKGGAAEYDRLTEAVALNNDAALKAASWGLFQILGSNFSACGYSTVDDYVAAMAVSASNHLAAFLGFCKANNLISDMQALNWAGFARAYNGPDFAANHYDTSLANAYARAKGTAETDSVLQIGEVGPSVAWLQQCLVKSGLTLDVDSNFGRVTQMALMAFQASHGLTVDGIAGPATLSALGQV